MDEPYGVRVPVQGIVASDPARVHVFDLDEVSPALLDRWRELSRNALEPNAFLSPDYVLPAARYLTPEQRLLVIAVEAGRRAATPAALGVFRESGASRRLPLRHLVAYRSRHSFHGGILLHRELAESAAGTLFRFLASSRRWHGVEFEQLDPDGPAGEAMFAAARSAGAAWDQYDLEQRAVIRPGEFPADPLTVASRHRRQEIGRRQRRLAELGEVTWSLKLGEEIDDAVVAQFLGLEHAGWKGHRDTSLLSRESDRAFFEELVHRWRPTGEIFFTQLAVDGRVIASNCGFVCGDTGFQFKHGWDPEFHQFGPGVLNAVSLLRDGRDFLARLSLVDSGAAEGWFMEDIWSGRRRLASGVFALSRPARALLAAVVVARRARQKLRDRLPGIRDRVTRATRRTATGPAKR